MKGEKRCLPKDTPIVRPVSRPMVASLLHHDVLDWSSWRCAVCAVSMAVVSFGVKVVPEAETHRAVWTLTAESCLSKLRACKLQRSVIVNCFNPLSKQRTSHRLAQKKVNLPEFVSRYCVLRSGLDDFDVLPLLIYKVEYLAVKSCW